MSSKRALGQVLAAAVASSCDVARATDVVQQHMQRTFCPMVSHAVEDVATLCELGGKMGRDPSCQAAIIASEEFSALGEQHRRFENRRSRRDGDERVYLTTASGVAFSAVVLSDDDDEEFSVTLDAATKSDHESSMPSLSETDDSSCASRRTGHMEDFLRYLSCVPPFSWFLAPPSGRCGAASGESYRSSSSSCASPSLVPLNPDFAASRDASRPHAGCTCAEWHGPGGKEECERKRAGWEARLRRLFLIPSRVPIEYLVLGMAALILFVAREFRST